MTAHTPGPWLNDHNTVRVYVGGNLEIVTVAPEWNALAGVAEANAARIVAAVNYCEGVPTETLERGGMSRSALRAECDALRAALIKAARFIEDGGDTVAFFETREAWRNALALCERSEK